MEKQHQQVESYIPAAAFYEGKREASGKVFRDRFAVVDTNADFSVLAFRGENLRVGETLPIDRADFSSLHLSLARGERALVAIPDGAALFFGDWIWKGLVPALLLREDFEELRFAASILHRFKIIPIGKEAPDAGKRELSDTCRRFSESLAECDRVFTAENTDRFRSHAARIAGFAGCRADFSNLPFDNFALFSVDARKWTLFLLCLLLSLRGVGGEEDPSVSLREIGRETILPNIDIVPSREPKRQSPVNFSFLKHPAFSDVIVEPAPEGVRFSIVLSCRPKEGELRAVTEAFRFFFLLEIA